MPGESGEKGHSTTHKQYRKNSKVEYNDSTSEDSEGFFKKPSVPRPVAFQEVIRL